MNINLRYTRENGRGVVTQQWDVPIETTRMYISLWVEDDQSDKRYYTMNIFRLLEDEPHRTSSWGYRNGDYCIHYRNEYGSYLYRITDSFKCLDYNGNEVGYEYSIRYEK